MANEFVTKRSDTRPLRALLKKPGGASETFPSHTARFLMTSPGGSLLVDAACTVFATVQTDSEGNEYNIQYSPAADDFNHAQGGYRAEFEVIEFPSGVKTTYPTDGFISIQIVEDLD